MKIISMKSLKHQRGLGMIQWALVLAVAGFFLMFAFKVVPLYAENRYVESALRALVSTGEKLEEMSDQEIRRKLDNFYLVNNVRSEGPTTSIKIDRASERVLVTVDYETRINLFANIDLVTIFKNHLDSRHPSVCCHPAPDARNNKTIE